MRKRERGIAYVTADTAAGNGEGVDKCIFNSLEKKNTTYGKGLLKDKANT